MGWEGLICVLLGFAVLFLLAWVCSGKLIDEDALTRPIPPGQVEEDDRL